MYPIQLAIKCGGPNKLLKLHLAKNKKKKKKEKKIVLRVNIIHK